MGAAPRPDMPQQLLAAAITGHADQMEALHAQGVEVAATYSNGTAAHAAAQNGHKAMVRALAELGCPMAAADSQG